MRKVEHISQSIQFYKQKNTFKTYLHSKILFKITTKQKRNSTKHVIVYKNEYYDLPNKR